MNKRTSIFTKITSLVMAGALLAVSMPGTSLPVKAGNTDPNQKWDEDTLNKIIPDGKGGMEIAFQDKVRDPGTNIIYQTTGYTLSMEFVDPKTGTKVPVSVKSSFYNPDTGTQNSVETRYTEGGVNKVQTVKSTSAATLLSAFETQYPGKGAEYYKIWQAASSGNTTSPYFRAAVCHATGIMAVSEDGGASWTGGVDPLFGTGIPNTSTSISSKLAKALLAAGNTGIFDLTNPAQLDALLAAEGWSAHARKSFETHIDKKYWIGPDGKRRPMTDEEYEAWLKKIAAGEESTEEPTDPTEPPVVPTPDPVTPTEKIAETSLTPKIYTYNDARNYSDSDGSHTGFSDEYDSDGNGNGTIIPSGEKYVNGLYTDSTAGSAAIGMHGTSHTFALSGFNYYFTRLYYQREHDTKTHTETRYNEKTGQNEQYSWQEELSTWHYKCVDSVQWTNNTSVYSGRDTGEGTVTGSVSRNAYYLYLYDLNLYDFSGAQTANDTFTNDTQDYASTDQHLANQKVTPSLDGPVNSLGSYTSTTNRPTYDVKLACEDFTGELTGESTPVTVSSMKPVDDAHVEWTNISVKNSNDYNLGHMGDINYFPESDDFSNVHSKVTGQDGGMHSNAVNTASNLIDKWVGYGKTTDNIYSQSSMSGEHTYAKVTSDTLKVGYNANTIMAGQTHNVIFDQAEKYTDTFAVLGAKYPSYLSSEITSTINNMKAHLSGDNGDHETYESSPAFGKDQQTIPKEQANGSYATSINSMNYKNVLISNANDSAKSSTNSGILSDYLANEEIIVQTPVVSPVAIYDDPGTDNSQQGSTVRTTATGTTQLVDGNRDSDLIQLRLDEAYWFKFDPRAHLQTQGYIDIDKGSDGKFDNTWSDDDIKFDKYVKAKYVHFPYAVCIYMNGSTKPTYYPYVSDENDPNYWVKLYDQDSGGKQNIEWTKFYIPSWANEGSYKGKDGIRYKVEAQNVSQGTGSHDSLNDDGEDLKHPDKDLYIATYDIATQVSGWIYDFEVDGINNRDYYDRDMTIDDRNTFHDLYYQLAFDYQEKKSGIYNRFGGDDRCKGIINFVRYTRDGLISHTGDEVKKDYELTRNTSSTAGWNSTNTLVIDGTKTPTDFTNPCAPKGTEFAFTVKTISNLWNTGDTVKITPTFRYFDKTGKEYEFDTKSGTDSEDHGKLHVYYDDVSGKGHTMVEYGSAEDKSLVQTFHLGNEMFAGTYNDDDLALTAQYPKYDDSTRQFTLTKKADNDSALSNLKNLFINKEEKCDTLSSIVMSTGLRIFAGNTSLLKANTTEDRGKGKSLSDMYDLGSSKEKVDNVFGESMQTWYGEYRVPSSLYVTTLTNKELEEYASKHGGVNEDSKDDDGNPIFMPDGYLIVHFDITTGNETDPKKDLVYNGGNDGSQDMWKDQGEPKTIHVGDDDKTEIPAKSGDVIVINMSNDINEWYKAGIWTIN